MSVSLSVAQLCKHVMKISVEEFETKKLRGDYKKNNGAPVKAAVAKVWDNLEKIFPSSEQVVKENVSKTKMRDSVRALLTAKTASSVVLYTFTEEREMRKDASLDESLDTTLDNSLPKELMAIEIEDLKTQNKKLQKELDALRPIHNLFKRVPKTTGRGGHYSVSDEMNNIAIRALSFGCVSAQGLHEFCRIVAEEFPVLMKPLNESDDSKQKFQLPSHSYLCDLRYDLEYVSDRQTDEFIEAAESLFLTCDDTSTNRESKSLLGTGVINEKGTFHSYKNKLVLGSTADDKAKHIIDVLTPQVTSRLSGIVADTLHAQKKASKIVLDHVRSVTGKEDLPIEQNNCFLHTNGNVNKDFVKMLVRPGEKPGEGLIHRVDKALEIIFASRIGSGFHRESLRPDLESKLKKTNSRTKYFFKSRLGSRSGIEVFNSLSLVLYKDKIVECLEEKIADQKLAQSKKPKNKQNGESTRFEKLLDSIKNDWPRLTSQCSMAIIFWYVFNEPMKEAESIKTSVTRLKQILTLIDERFQVIQDCESDHFEELRRKIIKEKVDEKVESVLKHCEEQWKLLSEEERKELDIMTLKGCQKAYTKFKKDTEVIFMMEDSEKVMPVSNKPQESYFSHYKRNEKMYLYMTDSMLEVIAKCKINKTDEWFHKKGQEGKRMLLANARNARQDLNLQRKRVSQDFNDQFANRKRKSN